MLRWEMPELWSPADLDPSAGCTAEESCGLGQVSAGLGAIPGRKDPWERSGVLVDVLSLREMHRGV